jgi:mannose-1-phosphate guanylyltransferase/mannose-6-phosphate isomerase
VSEVHRPWGKFRQYAHNLQCTVSLMTVKEGQRLSFQAHRRRSELWIVLTEGCEIQIGETVYHPAVGAELWIPADTPHRLGSGNGESRVLEVAFGDWQQDDIIRYQDDYGRE